MELYQLRSFLMIAEEGHLTRAAKRLNTSQPAISTQIKALEKELGVALFRRTAKGMLITDEGNRIKEYAKKILTTSNDLVLEAVILKKNLHGELKIGMNSEPESLRIPNLFSEMKKQHPEIRLQLRQCMTGDLLNRLEDGILDAGYMYGESSSKKIYAMQLQEQRLVVAGPASWQGQLTRAKPKDLERFQWIVTPHDCPFHTVMTQFFYQHKISPTQVAMVDEESTISAMIKAGVGISLLLVQDVKKSVFDELAIWPGEEFRLPLSIACLKKRQNEPMIQALLSTLFFVWGREQAQTLDSTVLP